MERTLIVRRQDDRALPATPQVIVALDYDHIDTAFGLVDQLDNSVAWYKVGKQMFTRYGPRVVEALKTRGKSVFLDLKFHDIASTVANAVDSAVAIGADMINVHAVGGRQMLLAAANAAKSHDRNPWIIGVTVLTGLDREQFLEIGYARSLPEQAQHLAGLAKSCGLDGVVCSAHEIDDIKRRCGTSFVAVVPGIRLSGMETQDQKRIATPSFAAESGADYLVVGRPVTLADDPLRVVQRIKNQIGSVVDRRDIPA